MLMKLTHKRLGDFPAVSRPLSGVAVSPLDVIWVGVQVTDFLYPEVTHVAAGLCLPVSIAFLLLLLLLLALIL